MTYSKFWKIKNFHPRILYPAKLPFRYEGEIEAFPEKQSGGSSSPLNLLYRKCWNEKAKHTKLWEDDRQNLKTATLYQNR